ncbi:MAG: 4-hydroxythreonine-4-phosphate dehydrogenase PdxA [bacterium]
MPLNRLLKEQRPVIALTIGDPNGVGPEVLLRALANESIRRLLTPIVVGPRPVLEKQLKTLGLKVTLSTASLPRPTDRDDEIPVVDEGLDRRLEITPGKITRAGGMIAGQALEQALELADKGVLSALVTAPISKEALHLAGYNYPGHTEFLAEKSNVDDVVMVLLSGNFRVALVTTHCPLSEVPQRLSVEKIVRKLQILDKDLSNRFRINKPKIAVAALNPHAGENGLFGHEEQEIILPAIRAAQELGIDVHGPFSADSLFTGIDKKRFDVYLAMYHDQGLIPLKMRAFGKGINYTAGLPLIRTSPDHGTAFDIAGRGVADSTSMEEAIKLAVRLAKNCSEG